MDDLCGIVTCVGMFVFGVILLGTSGFYFWGWGSSWGGGFRHRDSDSACGDGGCAADSGGDAGGCGGDGGGCGGGGCGGGD